MVFGFVNLQEGTLTSGKNRSTDQEDNFDLRLKHTKKHDMKTPQRQKSKKTNKGQKESRTMTQRQENKKIKQAQSKVRSKEASALRACVVLTISI